MDKSTMRQILLPKKVELDYLLQGYFGVSFNDIFGKEKSLTWNVIGQVIAWCKFGREIKRRLDNREPISRFMLATGAVSHSELLRLGYRGHPNPEMFNWLACQ